MSAVLGMVLSWLIMISAAPALPESNVDAYLCDGDPLRAQVEAGAVDAADIPNAELGTVSGAYVVLQWRGVSLQLPRTNNAGIPSFSDGRWWWQVEDPEHPSVAQRRGAIERYSCDRA